MFESRKIDHTKDNIKLMAVSTLHSIWKGIDFDKVDAKRAYGIWDEFTSKVKAAAMTTNSYGKFITKLCKKMDVRSLASKTPLEVEAQGEEFSNAVLRYLREETPMAVLQLRLNNELRKELEKEVKRKQEEQEERQKAYNDTQVSFTKKGVKVDE